MITIVCAQCGTRHDRYPDDPFPDGWTQWQLQHLKTGGSRAIVPRPIFVVLCPTDAHVAGRWAPTEFRRRMGWVKAK